MKKLIPVIFLMLSLKTLAKGELYITSSQSSFAPEDIAEVIGRVTNEDPKKSILFYIHGRGKHPEKGLKYLPRLEKRYGIRVIMFHWPSWKNSISRPVENAILSANELNIALRGLHSYKMMSPEKFTKRKLSLLFHSMGNIVGKTFIEDYYNKGDFNKEYFDTIIFNAPDVPNKKHRRWMDKVDFSSNTYVIINSDDSVLIGSKAIDYSRFKFLVGARLGASIRKFFITFKERLSPNVNYLNISKMTNGGHRHFLNDNPKEIAFLTQLFSPIIKGKKLNVNQSFFKTKKKDNVTYFQELTKNK